eukprot:TRINITY_DN108176_c0_g1_i1.p1 TRINITY_DN108176_c0_g1~~TRINITY_DN108176_c0_g1_i1.p1  ORF type:complete len:208 (+),score=55.27 TRINITY_DN108176_c0_g1_i1:52-675(+)
MFSIVAYLTVKEDCVDKFQESFAKQAARVHNEEPGCLLYQLCKDRKIKGKFTVIELYQDKEAVKTHARNLAANGDPAQAAMLAAPPEVLTMPVLWPPGLKSGIAELAIVAEIPVKDMDGFEKATLPLIDDVISKEAGNLLYCFAKHPKESKLIVSELYANKEALQAHSGSDHFKAAGPRQAPFLSGAPKLAVLATVGSGGAKLPSKL